jgi:hypothetical protein
MSSPSKFADWKDQALHLAQMWMTLAVIEEELAKTSSPYAATRVRTRRPAYVTSHRQCCENSGRNDSLQRRALDGGCCAMADTTNWRADRCDDSPQRRRRATCRMVPALASEFNR